ncbi:MAG: DUF4097 family beta strand repeat protein [Synergistetes bacterium]|nr:DUF4097 family beta strand repeat protein [Synergistota bacterium]
MSESYSQLTERTLPIPEENRVIIRNLHGGINLKTWSLKEIKITMRKEIFGEIPKREAEHRLKRIELKEKSKEDVKIIEVMAPLFIFTPGVKIRVDLDIVAPPYLNLEIDTGMQKLNGSKLEGDVSLSYREKLSTHVKNVKGNVNISSDSADVVIESSEGKISVESSSGNLILKNVAGELSIMTSSGNIVVEGGKGILLLKTRCGNMTLIDIESLILEADSTSGNITIDIRPLEEGNYRIETLSGAIRIKLPFHSSCFVKFETKCGKIFSEPLFNIEEDVIKLGTGEGKMNLKTSSGDIYILHGFIGEENAPSDS